MGVVHFAGPYNCLQPWRGQLKGFGRGASALRMVRAHPMRRRLPVRLLARHRRPYLHLLECRNTNRPEDQPARYS